MNDEFLNQLIRGAVGGLVGAAVIDINAWSKTNEPFDWGLAVKRWLAGAVTGLASSIAMSGG